MKISNNRLLLLFLTVPSLILVGCEPSSSQTDSSSSQTDSSSSQTDSSSEDNDAVKIFNKADLKNITNDLTASYKLMNDIDLSGDEWEPIDGFSGILDGQKFRISGMEINSKYNSIGLFGEIGEATVKNLRLYNSVINVAIGDDAPIYVGTLIGSTTSNKQVVLDDVGVEGSEYDITCDDEGDYYIGGIVGYAQSKITIQESYNNSVINGDNYVGGFIGYVEEATLIIESSYNKGNISGSDYVGGLIGYGYHNCDITILESYNSGKISASEYTLGGLVGVIYESNLSVRQSYNVGEISGKDGSLGGILGYADKQSNLEIDGSYNTGNITTDGSYYLLGGLVGGAGDSEITIERSYNSGEMTTSNEGFLGGIIGVAFGASIAIKNCFNNKDMNVIKHAGGIIGEMYDCALVIEHCHNSGHLTGTNLIGGLIGGGQDTDIVNSSVSSSINFGNVKGNYEIGGIIGQSINDKTFIINCFYTGNIFDSNGNSHDYPTLAGDFKEGSQVNPSFLINLGWDQNIWDFTNMNIPNRVYPTLK